MIQAVVNAATEVVDGVAVHATDKAIVDNKSAVSQYCYDLGLNLTDVSLATITDDTATVAAAQQFTNRVAVSDYTADTLETVAVEDIDSTLSFATALTVTDDMDTVTAAEAVVNDTVAATGGQTYAVAAASSSVVEGDAINFTVTLGLAVSTDTVVNYQIQGTEVAGGTATPVADLGVLNGTVTILAGETTGTITLTPASDSVTEGYEGFKVVLLDSEFAEIATSGNVVISDPANAGQTFS